MFSSMMRPKILKWVTIATALLLIIVSFHLTGCATANGKQALEPVRQAQPVATLEEEWGVEITSIRMTAANHMVDFRYRVLDADKAGELFKRQNKPYLIDQASQKVLAVPSTAKVGPLRNSNTPKQDRTYWMFFGNTRKLVKAGSEVTVVIGDFKAENLVIE